MVWRCAAGLRNVKRAENHKREVMLGIATPPSVRVHPGGGRLSGGRFTNFFGPGIGQQVGPEACGRFAAGALQDQGNVVGLAIAESAGRAVGGQRLGTTNSGDGLSPVAAQQEVKHAPVVLAVVHDEDGHPAPGCQGTGSPWST
jgi:hypothetical protein